MSNFSKLFLTGVVAVGVIFSTPSQVFARSTGRLAASYPQSDWSGGLDNLKGQPATTPTNWHKYASSTALVEGANLTLEKNASGVFLLSGNLVSSVYELPNLSDNNNFRGISFSWKEETPQGTSVTLKLKNYGFQGRWLPWEVAAAVPVTYSASSPYCHKLRNIVSCELQNGLSDRSFISYQVLLTSDGKSTASFDDFVFDVGDAYHDIETDDDESATPPPLSVVGPNGVTTNSHTAIFDITISNPYSFTCRIDGSAFVPCAIWLTESSPGLGGKLTIDNLSLGIHELDVIVDNVSKDTQHYSSWLVAESPPPAPNSFLDSIPAKKSNVRNPTFAFHGTQSTSLTCRLNASAWTACTSPHTLSDLPDGVHKFEVRATDSFGNTDATPAYYYWAVDTIVPHTLLDTLPDKKSKVAAPSFTFHANQTATFTCRFDGGTWETCVSPHVTANLPDGVHKFEVRATDLAGNTDASPAYYFWAIDTFAPNTFIDAKFPSTRTSPATFWYHGSQVGTLQCRFGTAAWTPCVSPKQYSNLGVGTFTFSVRAIDLVGNIDATPATFVWTVK